MSNVSTELNKKLARVKAKEQEILKLVNKENGKKTILCAACEKRHAIKDLVLIQKYWYTPPRGCSDGDYWLPGEIRFICPSTDVVNRLLFNTYDVPWDERDKYENDPQKQFVNIYGSLFQKIEEVYEKNSMQREWVNNYYIDKNRESFGLVVKRNG